MIARRILTAVGVWLIVLISASRSHCEVIGVYDAQKLVAERVRLETRTKELWQVMYDRLLTPNERAALKQVRLAFPTLSPDGSLLNFYADSRQGIVYLPIHSLLLLEDVCTAYAWLYHKGYSAITINEYASMLKHRRPSDFPGGEFPPPLRALGIPDAALSDKQVSELSLRFRNSAYAYVLGHEVGHILNRHPDNRAVRAGVSRTDERQADEFALHVLRRDRQIPMGAILLFQMTAFTASPGRFDYPTIEEWQKAMRAATHPVTSDRVRTLAEGLRDGSDQYGTNREIAVDVADKPKKIAAEMDDRDWQLYFRRIGEHASLTTLRPRRQ
jgi:hypothetical protein